MTNAQTAATLQPIEIRCACGHLFGKMPEMGLLEVKFPKEGVRLFGIHGVVTFTCRCGREKSLHLTRPYSEAIKV